MTIDDGGPAFPHHTSIPMPDGRFVDLHEYGACIEGMSLRDWFAGLAMQTIQLTRGEEDARWAFLAYRRADAMMAERTEER